MYKKLSPVAVLFRKKNSTDLIQNSLHNLKKSSDSIRVFGIVFFFILLIVGPSLWNSGGIILLDFVITPNQPIYWYQPIVSIFVQGLSHVFGHEIASKAFFVSILLISGYLGISIANLIVQHFKMDENSREWMKYLGAIFFLVNPFMYERMITQPQTYLGIILLGLGILYLFTEKIGSVRWLMAGICFGCAWSIFPHAIFMVGLIFMIWGSIYLRGLKAWQYFASSVGILVLINVNWLLAAGLGVHKTTTALATYGEESFQAFMTNGLPPLGPIMTNISLYGFWAERYHYFVLPSGINTNWYGMSIIILMFVGGGWILSVSRKPIRHLGLAFWLLLICSLTLGIGIASSITAPITNWMNIYIPYFRGFQEPQKWIGLVMIAYGYFSLLSIAAILQKWGKHLFVRLGVASAVFIVITTWAPGILFGFSGQLKNITFPKDFTTLKSDIIQDSSSGSTLALPWRSYVSCKWTNRNMIANPIEELLAPLPVISAENLEVGQVIYTNTQDTKNQIVENFLRNKTDFTPLGKLGIKSIVVMKCSNWTTYSWLETYPNCEMKKETDTYVYYSCR